MLSLALSALEPSQALHLFVGSSHLSGVGIDKQSSRAARAAAMPPPPGLDFLIGPPTTGDLGRRA